MKINIEKYLNKKREQLDVEQADDQMLWEGIRKELLTERKTVRFNIWKAAAIFLAIFTFSYIIYNEASKEKEREFTLSQINESLGEREKEYQQLIMMKMQTANINDLAANSEHEILRVLFSELNELDTIYLDAKNDLENHGYLEQIVEIVFDTYEKRIRILEQIIMESQKLEKYEKDTRNVSL